MHEIAVVVTSFERPGHLLRCLASLEGQQGVDGQFEVVVADDGSQDDTLERVDRWARKASFPLRVTTQEHDGFRAARCRNRGASASAAPYLLFVDGDCILPRDHLALHLKARRPHCVVGGDYMRLSEAASRQVDFAMIKRGDVGSLVSRREKARIAGKAARAAIYEWVGTSMRPRLSANNVAVWRTDFEAVNGFDERFAGWGHEDTDIQDRLERNGVRVRSILWRSPTVHLWHAPDASFVRNGTGTANRLLFETGDRPIFCAEGLLKRGAKAPSARIDGTTPCIVPSRNS